MSGAKPAPLKLSGFSVRLGDRLLFDIDEFAPEAGSSTVIIGATGSGKSVLLKAISGLLPAGPFAVAGDMELHGVAAYAGGRKAGFDEWKKIRRAGITFVPAETAQAVNPALSLDQNLNIIAPEARELVESRLAQYFSLDFKKYAAKYPDEVSGGELQRITLIILLSHKSDIVFLDEPTVNLDRQLRRRFSEFLNKEILGKDGRTVLMVSHDLDFVRSLELDKIIALENARLTPMDRLPETEGMEKAEDEADSAAGLVLKKVTQGYMVRSLFGERRTSAFKDLDVSFRPGHIYGITGPSGCGKTSMIRAILRLLDHSSGQIMLGGQDLVALKPSERGYDPEAFKPFRKKIAIVQQDSRFSFFPDLRIRASLKEIHKVLEPEAEFSLEGLERLMEMIHLPEAILDSFPKSLSSGEMKRMDIVRVLASRPEVILLDEPFAHIDFETRALVMKAISEYLAESKAILIVVTHEDFDLKYFIQTDYDFPSLV
ncbi:MAG TPA: ATP-binding cassette domain-containing protein, partial [Spirochaetia bacterium]|nr:ATP-binding cassette domain-containing protein [Spirochaetia bacterium]